MWGLINTHDCDNCLREPDCLHGQSIELSGVWGGGAGVGEGLSYRKYVTSQDESVVINEVIVLENAVLFVYRMIICLILNIFN